MTEDEMRRDAVADVLALVRPGRTREQALAIFDRWCGDPLYARAFVAAFRLVLQNSWLGLFGEDGIDRHLDALELSLRDVAPD